MATAHPIKALEGLQLVVRYLMPFQTLSFGYRTPFFNKQGTFVSQFLKNEQNPQNYEYMLSNRQHRKITQASEWDATEDQEEVDNYTFLCIKNPFLRKTNKKTQNWEYPKTSLCQRRHIVYSYFITSHVIGQGNRIIEYMCVCVGLWALNLFAAELFQIPPRKVFLRIQKTLQYSTKNQQMVKSTSRIFCLMLFTAVFTNQIGLVTSNVFMPQLHPVCWEIRWVWKSKWCGMRCSQVVVTWKIFLVSTLTINEMMRRKTKVKSITSGPVLRWYIW